MRGPVRSYAFARRLSYARRDDPRARRTREHAISPGGKSSVLHRQPQAEEVFPATPDASSRSSCACPRFSEESSCVCCLLKRSYHHGQAEKVRRHSSLSREQKEKERFHSRRSFFFPSSSPACHFRSSPPHSSQPFSPPPPPPFSHACCRHHLPLKSFSSTHGKGKDDTASLSCPPPLLRRFSKMKKQHPPFRNLQSARTRDTPSLLSDPSTALSASSPSSSSFSLSAIGARDGRSLQLTAARSYDESSLLRQSSSTPTFSSNVPSFSTSSSLTLATASSSSSSLAVLSRPATSPPSPSHPSCTRRRRRPYSAASRLSSSSSCPSPSSRRLTPGKRVEKTKKRQHQRTLHGSFFPEADCRCSSFPSSFPTSSGPSAFHRLSSSSPLHSLATTATRCSPLSSQAPSSESLFFPSSSSSSSVSPLESLSLVSTPAPARKRKEGSLKHASSLGSAHPSGSLDRDGQDLPMNFYGVINGTKEAERSRRLATRSCSLSLPAYSTERLSASSRHSAPLTLISSTSPGSSAFSAQLPFYGKDRASDQGTDCGSAGSVRTDVKEPHKDSSPTFFRSSPPSVASSAFSSSTGAGVTSSSWSSSSASRLCRKSFSHGQAARRGTAEGKRGGNDEDEGLSRRRHHSSSPTSSSSCCSSASPSALLLRAKRSQEISSVDDLSPLSFPPTSTELSSWNERCTGTSSKGAAVPSSSSSCVACSRTQSPSLPPSSPTAGASSLPKIPPSAYASTRAIAALPSFSCSSSGTRHPDSSAWSPSGPWLLSEQAKADPSSTCDCGVPPASGICMETTSGRLSEGLSGVLTLPVERRRDDSHRHSCSYCHCSSSFSSPGTGRSSAAHTPEELASEREETITSAPFLSDYEPYTQNKRSALLFSEASSAESLSRRHQSAESSPQCPSPVSKHTFRPLCLSEVEPSRYDTAAACTVGGEERCERNEEKTDASSSSSSSTPPFPPPSLTRCSFLQSENLVESCRGTSASSSSSLAVGTPGRPTVKTGRSSLHSRVRPHDRSVRKPKLSIAPILQEGRAEGEEEEATTTSVVSSETAHSPSWSSLRRRTVGASISPTATCRQYERSANRVERERTSRTEEERRGCSWRGRECLQTPPSVLSQATLLANEKEKNLSSTVQKARYGKRHHGDSSSSSCNHSSWKEDGQEELTEERTQRRTSAGGVMKEAGSLQKASSLSCFGSASSPPPSVSPSEAAAVVSQVSSLSLSPSSLFHRAHHCKSLAKELRLVTGRERRLSCAEAAERQTTVG